MRRMFFAYIAFVVAAMNTAIAADEFGHYVAHSSFDNVVFELENAIVGRGLVIHSSGNQFARMLDRTGADIGSSKQVYKDATFVEFCSAKHARLMVEADPSLIGNCPFVLYVYVRPEQPNDVIVGFRRLAPGQSTAARAAVVETETFIDAIARDAAK